MYVSKEFSRLSYHKLKEKENLNKMSSINSVLITIKTHFFVYLSKQIFNS